MITVIGGSGFIGTRLCRLFKKKGLEFNIIDKIISQTFEDKTLLYDITNKENFSKINLESSVLINLAAEHKDNVSPKSLYHEVNVNGAINACKLADKNNIKTIIFTSSVAVYGFAEIGINESGKIQPFNEYGKTKFEAEKIYIDWQKKDQENRKLIIIRPTVVFGEQNRGNVYNLFKSIADNKFLMVGSGKNIKSMAYVENLCSFINFSLSFDNGLHIYNYVDKPDLDMNSLVKKIKLNLGKSAKIRFRVPYVLGLLFGYILTRALKKLHFLNQSYSQMLLKKQLNMSLSIRRKVKFFIVNN